mmetsp:Transcript_64505/g.210316  ORF Transcript_64505/g.210316 Transcript_64505/m.210316 type:complete len:282 (+) Transcript_64505:88-933(+)
MSRGAPRARTPRGAARQAQRRRRTFGEPAEGVDELGHLLGRGLGLVTAADRHPDVGAAAPFVANLDGHPEANRNRQVPRGSEVACQGARELDKQPSQGVMARQSRWARATHGNGGWSRHRNLMMPGNRTRLWVANGRSIDPVRAGTGTPCSAAANKGATAATTSAACWGQVRNWEAPTRTGTRAARCVAPDRSAAVAADHLRGPEVAAVARIHGRQMRCRGAVFAARRLDLSGGGLPGEVLPTILLGCPLRSNLPPLRRLHELGARPVDVRWRRQPILGGD